MGLVALTIAWMQIRLHVAHLDHPILGDDMYGLQVSPVLSVYTLVLLLRTEILCNVADAADVCTSMGL